MPPQPEIVPDNDLAAALHEVSNALTVVLGWASSATTTTDPLKIRAALDIIQGRAAHARTIARAAIGAAPPDDAPAPVAATAKEVVRGLSIEAKKMDVTLTLRVEPNAKRVSVPFSPALDQVLTNLLLNAIAFSPPSSNVEIKMAAISAERVLISVEDRGPGILPDQRDRVFEGGVSTRSGGAGIGLRHSSLLAKNAGGVLRLGSSKVGTRFEIEWPITQKKAASASGKAAQSPKQTSAKGASITGKRILIVEDDEAVIELLELSLEARGASVVSVRARGDLGRALQTGRFDAVLLDMSPLKGDVDGAIAELRRASPDARLIVMSGSVPHPSVRGAASWVRKPFEVREIVDALCANPMVAEFA